ncbi:hypothetical protein SprV_0401703200 [Sparganum proliferum]
MATGVSLDAPVSEIFKTLSDLFDHGPTPSLALEAFWSRRQLATELVDTLPDVSPSAGEFILDTDASDRAIGAVLSQLTTDGDEKAKAFASRELSKQERRYSTTRREIGANESLRLVTPKAKIRDTISDIHNQLGHAGQRKTEAAVRRRFWWPTIHQDVVSYCTACKVCAQIKSPIPAPRALLYPIAVDGPNHRIGVDIIGPLPTTRRGNRFILVMVDYFTKWCEAVPLQTQDTKSVAATILNDWISRYGAPTIIHSDRGTAFENHLLAELCPLLQIRKTRTPYHPEGNGLVESTNRTIKRILYAFVDRESSDAWDEHLPQCMLAYRTAVHDSTGFSPALLQLGHELRFPADIHSPLISAEPLNMGECTRALKERLVTAYRVVSDNIRMAQQHQKTCYDQHLAWPEYHVDDSVLLFRPRPPLGTAAKFHRPWQGPYIIVYQPFPDTFVLRDPQRPFTDVLAVHYNQIKPAPDCGPPPNSPLSFVPSGSLPPEAQTVEIPASNSQG